MTPVQLNQYAGILRCLRSSKVPLSCEQLARALSEPAELIPPLINFLISQGYPIVMQREGFALSRPTDLLFPWEFEGRMECIHFFSEINSTMTKSRELAKADCPPFTVVIAERQTQGKGRLKRTWISDEGGLYFTVVLRPTIPPCECGRINFVAAVVLATFLKMNFGVPAGVKWPNDILVAGRKIAGLLSEMETVGNRVQSVCIGIGLNVNNDPTPFEPNAISLKTLLGKEVPRAPLLDLFLDRFEHAVNYMSWEKSLEHWRSLSVTLNQKVKVATTAETVEGIAVDVDETGALLVRQSDGTIRTMLYGDCFIQPNSPEPI